MKPDNRVILSKIEEIQVKCDLEAQLKEKLDRYITSQPRNTMTALKMHKLYAHISRNITERNILLGRLRKRYAEDEAEGGK